LVYFLSSLLKMHGPKNKMSTLLETCNRWYLETDYSCFLTFYLTVLVILNLN